MDENTPDNTFASTKISVFKPIFFLVLFLIFVTSVIWVIQNKKLPSLPNLPSLPSKPNSTGSTSQKSDFSLKKFGNNEEFQKYLSQNQILDPSGGVRIDTSMPTLKRETAANSPSVDRNSIGFAMPQTGGGGGESVYRYSTTNVQVAGIDEPDIIKTDGGNIYYSFFPPFRNQPIAVPPLMDREVMNFGNQSKGYQPPKGRVSVVNALPPQNMSETAKIDMYGELIKTNDTLVVFSDTDNKIAGFPLKGNVYSPSWQYSLQKNTNIVTSRLIGSELYIITSSQPGKMACPIPLFDGRESIQIACGDIYYPSWGGNSNSVFTITKMSADSGQIFARNSFLASSNSTVVYMSPTSIYLSFQNPISTAKFMIDFFLTEGRDLLSTYQIAQLQKLSAYEISDAAKMTEMYTLIEAVFRGRDGDENLKIQNEFQNRISKWTASKMRDLAKTGIVKFSTTDLMQTASTAVPGRLLNQFSMDEYDGNLRIATTIDPRNAGLGFSNDVTSENDVMILDNGLKIVGVVSGLGKTERMYSVGFIGKLGYMVTFRQTDPFYVLDLSNPTNPRVTGELKIPGYSSYLHPLSANLILGIGEENNKVKVSLFDVSNPSLPSEIDKYILDDYWSEVGSNHHAFIYDSANQMFFLPGSRGGYLFSHAGNRLALRLAINEVGVKRGVYVNNYFYIAHRDGISAYDINSLQLLGKWLGDNNPTPIPTF